MIAGFAIVAAIGMLLVAFGIPLMRRRVRPNSLYGLRVPATFADEGVWYEANARSGRDLVILGALAVVAGVGLPLIWGTPPNVALPAAFALLALGTILVGAVGWRRANRLLNERRAGTGR